MIGSTLSGPGGAGGGVLQATAYTYYLDGCCGRPNLVKDQVVNNAVVQGRPADLRTHYEYDADGNRTDVFDPLGNHTKRTYDADSRLISETQDYGTPSARTVNYAYDALGRRVGLSDGKGQQTQFQYDLHSNLTQEAPPSGPDLNYQYDSDDRLTQRTDRLSRTWTLGYDGDSRLTNENFNSAAGGTLQQSYQYGTVGSNTDQMLSAVDPTGGEQFSYTHDGKVASEGFASRNRALDFGYNSGMQLVGMSLASINGNAPTASESFTNDALNRVTQYTDWAGNQFSFAYNPDNTVAEEKISAKQAGGGVKPIVDGIFEYDSAGHLLSVKYRRAYGGVLAKAEYSYDLDGNRLSRSDLSSDASYAYDGVNELTLDDNAAEVRGNETFSYDNAGNRSGQGISNTTETYSTPNNLNRLTSAGPDSFTYDNEGNRVGSSVGISNTAYTWDGKDRLSSVTLPDGSTVNYAYDWQNRMVSRTHGNETKTYLYGQGTQVLEETYNGTRSVLYGWGPDGVDSRIDSNGQSVFYLKDGLGSTLAMVDDQGHVILTYQYSAYGESLAGKDAVNPYRFEGGIGGRTDDDTDLVYFWNRWYDPQVGRWVSEDQIRWGSDTSNFYEFNDNNSPTGTDPSGLDAIIYYREGAPEFGHIGVALSGTINMASRGFYPAANASKIAIAKGDDVPGLVKFDTQPIIAQLTIHTTSCQDGIIYAAVNATAQDPPSYNLFNNNCAVMLEYWLSEAGIAGTDGGITPLGLFDSLAAANGGGD